MRIAVLHEALDTTGGVEYYLRRLLPRLTAAEHEVLVLAGRGSDPPPGVDLKVIAGLGPFDPDPHSAPVTAALAALEEFEPDAIYLHQVNSPHLLRTASGRWRTIRYIHNHGDTCPSGSRLLRHQRCDRIGGLACAAVNAREHCGTWRPLRFWGDIRRVGEMGEASGAVTAFLVASEFVRAEMLRQGFPATRVEVLPYIVEGPEAPPDYGQAESGRVLFAGRATREKGLVELVRALATVDGEWRLEVRATGYTLDDARDVARELGVDGRVEFAGWAAQGDFAQSLARAAVLALPSIWPEPFGIVGVQAGLHARPVAAFAGGGIEEWLSPGQNGLAVAPGQPAELGRAIGELLGDRASAARMGLAGRQLGQRFSAEAHVPRLLAHLGASA